MEEIFRRIPLTNGEFEVCFSEAEMVTVFGSTTGVGVRSTMGGHGREGGIAGTYVAAVDHLHVLVGDVCSWKSVDNERLLFSIPLEVLLPLMLN
jgi:hypothetical protein